MAEESVSKLLFQFQGSIAALDTAAANLRNLDGPTAHAGTLHEIEEARAALAQLAEALATPQAAARIPGVQPTPDPEWISDTKGNAGALREIDEARTDLAQLAQALKTSPTPATVRQGQASLAAITGHVSRVIASAQQLAGSEITRRAADALGQSTVRSANLARDTHQALFSDRIFDRYLVFASPEQETAYRENEEQRRRFIEEQLRHPNDPIAALAALEAERDQVRDAMAHGAARSPEAQPMLDRLTTRIEQQRAALVEVGQSPEEIDRAVGEKVRGFLRGQGLTEQEIDRRMKQDRPLDALHAAGVGQQDVRQLATELQQLEFSAPPAPLARKLPSTSSPPGVVEAASLDAAQDAVATLNALGGLDPEEPVVTAQAHLPKRTGQSSKQPAPGMR